VPDLPGCTSAAATTDEILRRATEAVRLWAEDALADGEKLPKPRSIEALVAFPRLCLHDWRFNSDSGCEFKDARLANRIRKLPRADQQRYLSAG
jgi:predicted RNase H-like HicB family nuclease